MSKHTITLTVNGKEQKLDVESDERLVDVLRDRLDFTGTKTGCEIGVCGACSVLLDGQIVNSCLLLAVQANGHSVTSIEGIADGAKLHPIQQAFIDEGAIQCGFCTPGMVINTKALLDENPRPSEAEIRHHMQGNICRCTGYAKIVKAVQAAAKAEK